MNLPARSLCVYYQVWLLTNWLINGLTFTSILQVWPKSRQLGIKNSMLITLYQHQQQHHTGKPFTSRTIGLEYIFIFTFRPTVIDTR